MMKTAFLRLCEEHSDEAIQDRADMESAPTGLLRLAKTVDCELYPFFHDEENVFMNY